MTQFFEIDNKDLKSATQMSDILKHFKDELMGDIPDLSSALQEYDNEALFLLKGKLLFIADCAQEQMGGIKIVNNGKRFEIC